MSIAETIDSLVDILLDNGWIAIITTKGRFGGDGWAKLRSPDREIELDLHVTGTVTLRVVTPEKLEE